MRPIFSRLILVLHLAGSAALAVESGKVEFNRDIRPILSDNCFYCHGPDKSHRKSGLRLDVREEAVKEAKSGDIAIVPGNPASSELLRRLASTDEEEMMPPPDAHKIVTPAQRELFRRWIEQGAEYQPHWAYITPRRPAVPAVKNSAWVKNPIDAFILANLEAKDLAPSQEADARTLLRRLSLDLTGLPPTPEELNEIQNSKFKIQNSISRLLASPAYGERMAVPWLDIVRYADTVGYHGDQNVNVFAYRDYVIDAFNTNKPFDQFTIEQIAGDLLPKPTPEQLTATCFNRLNMMTREGGAQPKEYLAKYSADRVRTVSGAWLGSTMGCNECHDHKFDPFTAKDFYALAAFFADVKQWGVYNDYTYTPNPELKGWSNEHPFPPELVVESGYLQRRQAQVEKRLAAHLEKMADARQPQEFAEWETEVRNFLAVNIDGWANAEIVAPPVPLAKPAKAKAPGAATQWTIPSATPRIPAIRTVVEPGDGPESKLHNGVQRGGLKLSAQIKSADGKLRPVAIYHAEANAKSPRYSNGFELPGVKDGWNLAKQAGSQEAVWLLDPPVRLAEGETLVVSTSGDVLVGNLRVSWSPFAALHPLKSAAPEMRAALLAEPRTPAQQQQIAAAFFLGTAPDATYKTLQREWLETRGGRTPVLITEAVAPSVTRVLPRGNWQDETGEVVKPEVPHFLPQPANAERLTRLDLARWLVAPENPLTARVFVNRLWKQFFGAGISAVVDDLGAQGEWPAHPELLDWLAVEFRESGWDVKHLVQLIVSSATYRQDSNLRPELRDRDPNNRWLASQNPRRLEAEFVRDNALAVAGLLNPEIGGPPVHPYQPARYYENLQFPDRDYAASKDDRQYRRGLYAHWQRTFLHPMLANFDAPSREECTAARTVANTPQQALTLLNDPTFVEAARTFAARLLTTCGDSDQARLALAYDLALARPIKPREQDSLRDFLAEQRAYYEAHRDDAEKLVRIGNTPPPTQFAGAELAAWTTVARVVLNLHETITRY